MFDPVPYRLLVRRVRSGDCDKIDELYAVVEPDLTAFCQSITADAATARRAADGAFVYAAELLAAQSLTVAAFRGTLLAEAKGRCHSEIGRAAISDVTADGAEEPARIDFAQLQSRLEQLRPKKLDSPAARLSWRSRMAPSTAVTVVLVMALMIEMAALNFDLNPQKPSSEASGGAAIEKAVLTGSAQDPIAQNLQPQKADDDSTDRDQTTKPKKAPRVDSPAPAKPDTDQTAPRSESNEQSGSSAADRVPAQVPVVGDVPDLPVPEVKVDVRVDPVDVQIELPGESGILPSASACVGSTCVSLP